MSIAKAHLMKALTFRHTLAMALALAGGAFALTACGADEGAVADDDAITSAGPSHYRPGNRIQGWGGAERGVTDEYLDKVQPVLAQRCVTCHGCATAGCQLKLTAFEGVARGATKHNLFAPALFSLPTGPTRLKDATTVEQWREKKFYSVTDGGRDSIMYRLLQHGAAENGESFDLANPFNLYKDKAENYLFEALDTKSALEKRLASTGVGMPFGLPSLPSAESSILMKWIEQGAKGPSPEAQAILETARDPERVKAWEDFLNQESPKARLASRYLFEHMYFGKIHLDDSTSGKGDLFEIVRAKNRTGSVQEIVTDRVLDDPHGPFFYRLKKHTQIVSQKDNIVFHLTDAKRKHYDELLFKSAWDAGPPSYASSNPFQYFEKIPGTIRSRFMLEHSAEIIDSMVKNDVCTGSNATYAIRDRFSIWWLKPESDPSALDPQLGTSGYPADPENRVTDLFFENSFEAAMKKVKPNGFSVEDLWDGDKTQKNAWVTVLRHGKNASSHVGVMAQFPETMWVLSYANFERLYYDLVVDFRAWENAAHKLGTWRTMSAIRANAEDTFLLFMPESRRNDIRKAWTPGLASFTESAMKGEGIPSGVPNLDPNRPVEDLVSKVRAYFGDKIVAKDVLNPDPMHAEPAPVPGSITTEANVDTALYSLTAARGGFSAALPNVTWVTIKNGDQSYLYSIIANRIYWSNSRVIANSFPSVNRRPELDSLSIVRGHIGSFPELFLNIPINEVAEVVRLGNGSPQDRLQVRMKYEVRRNSAEFWKYLDAEHARTFKENPLESGIIDTSDYLWPANLQIKSDDLVPR